MKKKFLGVLLSSAMIASTLAGCGSSSDTSTTESSESGTETSTEETATADVASEDENTLSVYAWDANFNIPALEAAEAAYQEVNPDFKLNIIEQSASSDVENAVTLAGSSGDYSQLPDIVLFQDHYIQSYVTNYPDVWVSVDDADVDWSDFGEEKLSYSTIDGVHYGFPVDNGTVVFAYNTEDLEAAGLTIDDMTGITWEEWLTNAQKIKDATGKYVLTMDGSGNDLPYMMLQAEGKSQFVDGEPVIGTDETVAEIVDVIVRGVQAGVISLENDWTSYTEGIMNDQTAGVMNGNWIIPTIEEDAGTEGKWEITSMPTLTGAEGYASNGGSSLYITSNCTKVELALDFLAYTFGGGDGSMDTYDNALRNGGVITTCISAGQSDVYNEGVEFFGGQAIYADIVAMGANVPVV